MHTTSPTPHPFWSTPEAATLLSRPRPHVPQLPHPDELHPVALGARHPDVPVIPTGGALAVVIPAAPPLDPDAPEYRHVHLLRRAFEGAVEARAKKLGLRSARCFTFRGRRVGGRPLMDAPLDPTSKEYAMLATAAKLMLDLDIVPAAWCAFVLDFVWLDKMQRTGVPPLQVVFSVDVFTRWKRWFEHELTAYATKRSVYPDFSHALMATYAEMRGNLAQLRREATDADVRAVVARSFPDGFAAALGSVQARLGVLRVEAEERIAQGKWAWDDRSTVVDGRWVW